MFCVKIRADAPPRTRTFSPGSGLLKVDHCTPVPTVCMHLLGLSGCFPELCLPGAESGHPAPESQQKSPFRSKQQRCVDDHIADVENDLSPLGWPQLLFSPGKINSRSLNQTGEFLVGGPEGEMMRHRHIYESRYQLSVIYNIQTGTLHWLHTANFLQSSLTPLRRI